MQQKIDFISYLAHELRSPLASQRWYSEMLLDGTAGVITNDQKNFLLQIYNSNKKIGELINKLLEIVHVENGKYILEPEQVDLITVVRDAIFNNSDFIKEKKLNIKTNFPKEDVVIFFDKKSLELVVNTIIDNAVKYNKDNGDINVEVKNNESYAEIKVEDTGIGIKDSEKEKIGNDMFRGENIKDKIEGTGLSLLLISKIIKLSGGIFLFESSNKGSVFIVKLPSKN